MLSPQFVLALTAKLVVDIFAGGGGWSTAYEQATGQHVHTSINHNANALSMRAVNHPQARHMISNAWEVVPVVATGGLPIGWLHLSPDCTDHSQAKGGQPRNTKIRALAWVTVYWAGTVRPDVISLENVVQVLKWGRLIAKRDPETGRVIKLSGEVAASGERVPVQEQYLVPDRKDHGRHWKKLVSILRSMGYTVEWKELNAADFGAGTTRKRLFMIAKCNGEPIVWPQAAHFKKPQKGQKRWVSASDGIDWSIEGKSIFNRPRPLVDATLKRVVYGTRRLVLESAEPFIVPIANWSRDGSHSVNVPLRTITARPRGGSHALVTAYMAQMNGGFNATPGHDLRKRSTTFTNTGSQQQLVTAHLATLRHHSVGSDLRDPITTVAAASQHHALIEYDLSPEHEAGALKVAAFLMRYYGEGGSGATCAIQLQPSLPATAWRLSRSTCAAHLTSS
jgi:DNA (cytosine-5)-methyltransferase 1